MVELTLKSSRVEAKGNKNHVSYLPAVRRPDEEKDSLKWKLRRPHSRADRIFHRPIRRGLFLLDAHRAGHRRLNDAAFPVHGREEAENLEVQPMRKCVYSGLSGPETI